MTKTSEDNFRSQLLETFHEEALEYLADIAEGLRILEKNDKSAQPDIIIENIYRKTHSLKGASRAVNIPEIVSICQNLENIFSAMLKGEFIPDNGVYDLFYRALRSIKSHLLENEENKIYSSDIVSELRNFLDKKKANSGKDGSFIGIPAKKIENGAIIKSETKNFSDKINEINNKTQNCPSTLRDYEISLKNFKSYDFSKSKDTVRIASEKLDRLIQGSDDLLTIRLFFSQRIKELENMVSGFDKWHWNDGQIFNETYKIQEIYHSYDFPDLPPEFERSFDQIRKFLDYNREFVTNLEHHLSSHIRAADIDRSDLEASTSEISDLIHDAVLLPFNSMIMSFPDYVREISKSLGKEVNLKIEGGNIDMDRRIMESLRDPMRHLIRNSIDHGIEDPGERISAGKSPSGEIKIKVYTLSGSRVGIKITDDGAGIDSNAVKRKAVEKGIITEKKAVQITEDETIGLIFRSGLTTSQMITEISGRGLGLAIVADAISHLSGEIELKTIRGKGTEFTITLPLTLATFRGVVVTSCEHKYVFPKQQVKKVISIGLDVLDRNLSQQTILVGDEKIGVIRLSDALGFNDYNDSWSDASARKVPVVIIAYGVGQIGFIVDEIVGVQEIVVRSLGTQLRQVKKISGAAVLGDGTTALVLDPLELIEEVLKPGQRDLRKGVVESSSAKILIVEDSITSRQYILNILKKRGFNAETAEDGAEAFLMLKESEFNLVVSDVDMPRMSGFTLTEKIRGDSSFSKIPVILVTSLDSPDDKKQGIISGADAYITKENFSEDDFISIVKNLLNKIPGAV